MHTQSLYFTQRLLFTLLACFFSVIGYGQEKDKTYSSRVRISDSYDFEVTHPSFGNQKLLGLHSEANKVDVSGKPTAAPSAWRFYYLPFFALKKDNATGKIMISERTSGEVVMPIIFDIKDARKIFRNHLIEQNLISETTAEGNVLMPSIKKIILETTSSYRYPISFVPRPLSPTYEGDFTT